MAAVRCLGLSPKFFLMASLLGIRIGLDGIGWDGWTSERKSAKSTAMFFIIYLVFPGSGKSLVIDAILESKQDQYKTILINCCRVSTPHSIFAEIAAKLGLSLNKENELNAADLQSASKKTLLVQSCKILTFHTKQNGSPKFYPKITTILAYYGYLKD